MGIYKRKIIDAVSLKRPDIDRPTLLSKTLKACSESVSYFETYTIFQTLWQNYLLLCMFLDIFHNKAYVG